MANHLAHEDKACPYYVYLFPTELSGDCLDPEILGTGSEKDCDRGAARAKPDLALPDAEGGGSRVPTTMEQT